MIGAITGDIIGYTYEFDNAGRYDFDPFPARPDFTDDTVLTVAIADAILSGRDYGESVREYATGNFSYNIDRSLSEIKPITASTRPVRKQFRRHLPVFLNRRILRMP